MAVAPLLLMGGKVLRSRERSALVDMSMVEGWWWGAGRSLCLPHLGGFILEMGTGTAGGYFQQYGVPNLQHQCILNIRKLLIFITKH